MQEMEEKNKELGGNEAMEEVFVVEGEERKL